MVDKLQKIKKKQEIYPVGGDKWGRGVGEDDVDWLIETIEQQQQEIKKLLHHSRDLINQVKKSEFSEENGHWLEMNDAYYQFVCIVGELEKVVP